MKVIIVGAHGEAKELINRISSGWSISVIDLDQDKLRNFSTNRQIEKIQGDATSSLVLKKFKCQTCSYCRTMFSTMPKSCHTLREFCRTFSAEFQP